VRYTTVNLYQSVPTTCNQPVPIACNQHVPKFNLYQQKPTGTQPVYAASHICMRHVYTATNICIGPIYIATFIHLKKYRFFTFMNLKHFHPSRHLLSLSHQPVTYYYIQSITTKVHQLYTTQHVTTTYLINIINQIRSTHQDQSPRPLSTICAISPR
jgi:hypothetical protein